MQVVEVQIVRSGFANVLGAMREWLDRNASPGLAQFETQADDGGVTITIKAQFNSDDSAELFRQSFRGSYGAGRRTSAREESLRRNGPTLLATRKVARRRSRPT
jgi:hypothetical protein